MKEIKKFEVFISESTSTSNLDIQKIKKYTTDLKSTSHLDGISGSLSSRFGINKSDALSYSKKLIDIFSPKLDAKATDIVNSKNSKLKADIYLKTFEESIHKLFEKEVGFTKRALIRFNIKKEVFSKYTGRLGLTILEFIDNGNPDLELRRELNSKKSEYGKKIIDWAVKKIY